MHQYHPIYPHPISPLTRYQTNTSTAFLPTSSAHHLPSCHLLSASTNNQVVGLSGSSGPIFFCPCRRHPCPCRCHDMTGTKHHYLHIPILVIIATICGTMLFAKKQYGFRSRLQTQKEGDRTKVMSYSAFKYSIWDFVVWWCVVCHLRFLFFVVVWLLCILENLTVTLWCVFLFCIFSIMLLGKRNTWQRKWPKSTNTWQPKCEKWPPQWRSTSKHIQIPNPKYDQTMTTTISACLQ